MRRESLGIRLYFSCVLEGLKAIQSILNCISIYTCCLTLLAIHSTVMIAFGVPMSCVLGIILGTPHHNNNYYWEHGVVVFIYITEVSCWETLRWYRVALLSYCSRQCYQVCILLSFPLLFSSLSLCSPDSLNEKASVLEEEKEKKLVSSYS